MRRIFLSCVLSIVIYLVLFGLVVDRPLSLGLLQLEISQKISIMAALPSPKLVILAGSNGPYSHSCSVIGDMLDMPCENAGIAVGIGLDEMFIRYGPLLHRGDILYMPMELQQYSATDAEYRAGVDGEILFRRDRRILAQLSWERILGAFFCCSLADILEAGVEMPLVRFGEINPELLLAGEYNAQGDRIDNVRADADAELLHRVARAAPDAADIAQGYGKKLIAAFVARESASGILVVGGLPTDFLGTQLSMAAIAEIASVYTANGGAFMALPNLSLYPPESFFNSEDHLAQPCQFRHSIAIAYRLAALLHRPVRQPSSAVLQLAAACPVQYMTRYPISAAR